MRELSTLYHATFTSSQASPSARPSVVSLRSQMYLSTFSASSVAAPSPAARYAETASAGDSYEPSVTISLRRNMMEYCVSTAFSTRESSSMLKTSSYEYPLLTYE